MSTKFLKSQPTHKVEIHEYAKLVENIIRLVQNCIKKYIKIQAFTISEIVFYKFYESENFYLVSDQ